MTAALRIEQLASQPMVSFGVAMSTYVAQNYGANKENRIKEGIKSAFISSAFFCVIISTLVIIFAKPLMCIFIDSQETEIISTGVKYLYIEGSCYIGIGTLFLLYGYYRAINKPNMSVILTIISLGTRVLFAYTLSAIPNIGVTGIWVSVLLVGFLQIQ